MLRVLFFDLRAPIQRLFGDQRRIDQDDAFLGVDEAGGAAAVVVVDKDAWGQLFPFAQASHANANGTASSCHDFSPVYLLNHSPISFVGSIERRGGACQNALFYVKMCAV